MGKITGFLEIEREERALASAKERVTHYREFVIPPADEALREQGARCMDCGIPYCQTGCPVNNQIPDWNDMVWQDDWRVALDNLHSTNNFPDFTGRICPAPCEAACTLNIIDSPVTIKSIECAIVDRGWQEGWIVPQIPAHKTGKKIAIIGSGPAGMAAAQQLARAGHDVHLYEKNQKAGGLLRYGIPDFKMEKHAIDKRVEQMQAEGVVFHMGAHIGVDIDAGGLMNDMDALILAGGAEVPRDLSIPGREFAGVHFAMDFLAQQNRRIGQESLGAEARLSAEGKHVVVIGGGDTGSDCIGTSFRQGAASVTQLEIMPQPPAHENKDLTWPDWPLKMRVSSSQAEGAARDFAVMSREIIGADGLAAMLRCIRVDAQMQAIAGSEFEIPAELILLAMGFIHPVHEGLLASLNTKLTARGNVAANVEDYASSVDKVFACGDMRRGQSLVVWAIREGRQCAQSVDMFLMGKTSLPR